jgi:alkylated DNA repair dioxygenase AlkB
MKRVRGDGDKKELHLKLDTKEQVVHILEKDVWIITTTVPQDKRPTKEEVEQLWEMKPKERGEIMMCGNMIPIPRFNQSYGKSYRFSGVEHTPLPITPLLQRYLDFANEVCGSILHNDYNGRLFNMIFLNWYEDGSQYIGYHSDNESQLYKNDRGETLVFSISFGGDRRFLVKSNVKGSKAHTYLLGDGTCLLMAGKCQQKCKHCVPKETTPREKRKNMTFRIVK